MRQYEIRWAHLPAPAGRRPVLLLTRTPAYAYLNKIIVAEITTHVRRIPQEVALGASEGLARPCVANLDNVRLVAKEWLGERIGTLPATRQAHVKRALGHALGWDELKAL